VRLLNNNEANTIYYNNVSKIYDKKHLIDMKDYPLFCKQIEYLMKPNKMPKGSLVLDCGCGTGRGALKFAKMGCNVVAVDISPSIVQICAHNAQKNNLEIETRVENCTNLSFPDETFDFVTLSAALHHMENLDLCLEELYRVTKKGGALVLIAEPKHSIVRPEWMRCRKEYLSAKYDREVLGVETTNENPDVHIFSLEELKAKLRAKGFTDIKTECFYFLSSIYRDLLFFRLKKQKLRMHLLQLFNFMDNKLLFWLPDQFYSLFNLIAWKR